MSENAEPKDEGEKSDPNVPEDKEVLGVPYDWRRPTVARAKSRMWNAEDPRMFPPKSFGAGWTINFYWLVHLPTYFSKNQRRS
ncbi:MAG: DUF5808 domain-containing protein [Acidimicrobiales bacterium]